MVIAPQTPRQMTLFGEMVEIGGKPKKRKLLMTKMQEMQKILEILEHKIEMYESALLQREKAISETEALIHE